MSCKKGARGNQRRGGCGPSPCLCFRDAGCWAMPLTGTDRPLQLLTAAKARLRKSSDSLAAVGPLQAAKTPSCSERARAAAGCGELQVVSAPLKALGARIALCGIHPCLASLERPPEADAPTGLSDHHMECSGGTPDSHSRQSGILRVGPSMQPGETLNQSWSISIPCARHPRGFRPSVPTAACSP